MQIKIQKHDETQLSKSNITEGNIGTEDQCFEDQGVPVE